MALPIGGARPRRSPKNMNNLLLAYLILSIAPVALGWQFEMPDLTRVHNTYAISGSTFDVIVSKDAKLSLHSVYLQIGDKKVSVPFEEMKNIGWPHLDKIIVTNEKDTIYVEIDYGAEMQLESQGIKNQLPKVRFAFENGIYVSRGRIVPIKQVFTDKEIITDFQCYTKLLGKEEEKSGIQGHTTSRTR